MVRPGGSDTSQRFVHGPNSDDSSQAFGVGDICLCNCPNVRAGCGYSNRCPRHSRNFILAGPTLESTVSAALQRLAPAVAIWISSQTFYSLSGIAPLSVSQQPIVSLVFPLFGLAVLYFLLNSWLIAFAVAFQKKQSAFVIWRHNLLWLSLNYFSGASVAALLLPYLSQPESVFFESLESCFQS